MVLVDDVDLFLAAPGFDQSAIVFLLFCLKQVWPSKTRQRAIWKPGTNSGFLPSRKGKNPEWRRKKKKPPLRRMGRAEGPKGREEQHPSCPRSNVTCATVKQFPAFQTTRHQLPQSLYWFDQRNSVDCCQEVISGFLLLFEGCPGLWKIETYSTEFFIKDASFDQVCEILKIGLSSKGGESIFALYWDWLRWYAVTLGSSYVEETPTYSRGWYWLAIEQILSSGMVLVDDVDLFLAAPGFDQSTIVFLLFCLKHVCSNKIIQRAIWKPGANSGFLPSRKGKNPEWRRKKKKKPPLRRMGRAEGPKGREEQNPPAAPDPMSHVPRSSNSRHSKPQGINYLQSLH